MLSKKDEYLQKLNARIEAQSAELTKLKATLKLKAGEGQAELRETIDSLEQKLDGAKAKAKQIAAATDDAWEGISDPVDEAWDGLFASVKGLFSKLR